MTCFDVEVMGSAIDELSESSDALLFGRRTWQVIAGAWPDRAGGYVNVMGSASHARAFELASVAAAGTGVQVCRYRRAG